MQNLIPEFRQNTIIPEKPELNIFPEVLHMPPLLNNAYKSV